MSHLEVKLHQSAFLTLPTPKFFDHVIVVFMTRFIRATNAACLIKLIRLFQRRRWDGNVIMCSCLSVSYRDLLAICLSFDDQNVQKIDLHVITIDCELEMMTARVYKAREIWRFFYGTRAKEEYVVNARSPKARAMKTSTMRRISHQSMWRTGMSKHGWSPLSCILTAHKKKKNIFVLEKTSCEIQFGCFCRSRKSLDSCLNETVNECQPLQCLSQELSGVDVSPFFLFVLLPTFSI